jgi:uncharacterized membrane protein
MENGKGFLLFLVFVACAAVFVWHTSDGLPPLVASHFGTSGTANGFMPRTFYVRFMLALVLGLPTIMTFVTWRALGSSNARINLPNRDYWLAPERRAETIAFLRTALLWLGVLLVAFLCFAHWLVVLANRTHPALLVEPWFFGGLGGFVIAVFIWLMVLLGHFRTRA